MRAMSHVEDAVQIHAHPVTLYEMVADITRMGEWSPENTGGQWLDGASGPRVHARFRGHNRRGLRGPDNSGPLRWSTECTVTEADPGRRFAFTVRFTGMEISEWSYAFERVGDGCAVTERWTDRRPAPFRIPDNAYVRLALGVRDRGEFNLRGIRTTLAALKSAVEPSTT